LSKNKKYHYQIEKSGASWQAKIVRQVSSKKTVVSKQKDAFPDQQSAQQWAEQTLQSFAAKQEASNKRHAEQRKLTEEQQRLRSARRAEKTERAKRDRDETEQED